MKNILTVCLLLVITFLSAQDKGSIVGKLTDKEVNNEPLAFANVLIKGTTTGTTSDFDGLYEIGDLAPGTYTLQVSYLGYETAEIPTVEVVAGKVTTVNVPMSASEGVSLDEVTVTTVARKDSEVALLLDQKKAVEIRTTIGAQELSRKGVGDAEGAVTNVTGVSKQEGVKNVFVRGLGDRYNSTTLNGLPLPSEDPEYKNIALDFFASDIINSVGINKAFNSSIYGDVAGANIDIESKELAGGSQMNFNISSGLNTRTLSKDFLIRDGTDYFGTPTNRSVPITNLGVYSFNNKLTPDSQNLQTNNNASISAGKKYIIGENDTFSVFLVGTFDSDYSYKKGESAIYNPVGGLSQDYDYEKFDYNVSQIAMGNLKYNFSNGNYLAYNGLYIHNQTQSIGEYIGFNTTANDDTSDPNAFLNFLRRQQVNDNQLLVNQLLSKINFGEKLTLDIGAAYNTTRSDEPDRSSFLYRFNGETYSPITGSAGANSRFYSKLIENDFAGKIMFSYNLNKESLEYNGELLRILKVGYNYRNTDRQFDFTQFNHDFGTPTVVDLNNPDGLYNQQNIANNTFRLITGRGSGANALVPFFYSGNKKIHSGIIDFTYSLSNKLVLNAGLRYEKLNQMVTYDTNLASTERDPKDPPASINENYLLPSFNLKYSVTENSIFRLAGSQSYTLPQFKEVAPFLYEDVSISSFGNTKLLPSSNYNLDLKWEYYFSAGEIIALTGYYKKIENPINRTQVNSAANQSSYVNTGNANVAGAELEIRKKLFELDSESTKIKNLYFGLNLSYLYSNQKLVDVDTDDLTVLFSDSESKLEGASPLLIVSDLTYSTKSEKMDFTTSLIFNYFAKRVYSLGIGAQKNINETSIPTLDWITKLGLGKNYGLSLNVRNILDPEFKLTQDLISGEEVNVRSFRKGINLSLGFSYKF